MGCLTNRATQVPLFLFLNIDLQRTWLPTVSSFMPCNFHVYNLKKLISYHCKSQGRALVDPTDDQPRELWEHGIKSHLELEKEKLSTKWGLADSYIRKLENRRPFVFKTGSPKCKLRICEATYGHTCLKCVCVDSFLGKLKTPYHPLAAFPKMHCSQTILLISFAIFYSSKCIVELPKKLRCLERWGFNF